MLCRRRRNRESYWRKANRIVDPRPSRHVPVGKKWCPQCKQAKPLDEFPTSNGQPFNYCEPCHNKRARESVERHHGSTRNKHLRDRYGIDDADVQRMVEEQGGFCAICLVGKPEHVDHDHATGKIRGILCFNCNGGLGQFKDRADVLRNAVTYLEASGGAAS